MGTSLRAKRSVYSRCIVVMLLLVPLLVAVSASAGEIHFQVFEEAGIRRFGYPVRVKLALPEPVAAGTNFRLLSDERPLTAQFRLDQPAHGRGQWWLDFNINLLPYESRQFTVQYGPQVSVTPPPPRGHVLTEQDDAFQVTNAPYITWTIPRNLEGLLKSVAFPPNDHLRADSPGLLMVDRHGTEHRVGGESFRITPHVVSHGQLGVALRFDVANDVPSLKGTTGVVDLYFPVSKSWVEVDWRVRDPGGNLSALAAEMDLNVEPPTRRAPTLVDFGASNMVYAALRAGQQAELRAGVVAADTQSPFTWQVLRGGSTGLEPFVSGPRGDAARARPEGWAHVMDQQSCLALAVHEFSLHGEDRIHTTAAGRVRIARRFPTVQVADNSGAQRLRFWLHFVFFPPHISAATSPQAMQNPLVIRW